MLANVLALGYSIHREEPRKEIVTGRRGIATKVGARIMRGSRVCRSPLEVLGDEEQRDEQDNIGYQHDDGFPHVNLPTNIGSIKVNHASQRLCQVDG
jgi:hypothetical protein